MLLLFCSYLHGKKELKATWGYLTESGTAMSALLGKWRTAKWQYILNCQCCYNDGEWWSKVELSLMALFFEFSLYIEQNAKVLLTAVWVCIKICKCCSAKCNWFDLHPVILISNENIFRLTLCNGQHTWGQCYFNLKNFKSTSFNFFTNQLTTKVVNIREDNLERVEIKPLSSCYASYH